MKITFKIKTNNTSDEKTIHNIKKIEKTRNQLGEKEWKLTFNTPSILPPLTWRFPCSTYKLIDVENENYETKWLTQFTSLIREKTAPQPQTATKQHASEK